MRKLSFILSVVLMITMMVTSCGGNASNETTTNETTTNESNNQTNDFTEIEEENVSEEKNTDNFTSDDNCTFNSDDDVFSYLIGKSFTQDGGGINIKFNESGAIISDLQYQWMTYTSLGGHKGKVKLSSTDPSNPDGTITLFVSCKEKAITDGEIVLFLD